MTQCGYCFNNNTENCTEMYGKSFCENISCTAYAALSAVCAFLLALMAVIISGAIISVIICIAIIGVIIICRHSITAREVYQS